MPDAACQTPPPPPPPTPFPLRGQNDNALLSIRRAQCMDPDCPCWSYVWCYLKPQGGMGADLDLYAADFQRCVSQGHPLPAGMGTSFWTPSVQSSPSAKTGSFLEDANVIAEEVNVERINDLEKRALELNGKLNEKHQELADLAIAQSHYGDELRRILKLMEELSFLMDEAQKIRQEYLEVVKDLLHTGRDTVTWLDRLRKFILKVFFCGNKE